jgi:cytochrome c nitrite reductase small subunit
MLKNLFSAFKASGRVPSETMGNGRHIIPRRWILPMIVLGGLLTGLGAYIIYMSRAHSYLSDDPAACVNCHIMTPYHHSWMHSSHAQWAHCNDCHVPHDNVFNKYLFKAKDGLYHSYVFTMRDEPMAIRPRQESCEVIMDNCIRCHSQLNREFVTTGMIGYVEAKENGKGKACWDCHREVPHGKVSNLASSPNAPLTPLPKSPVPNWLKKIMK